MPEALELFAAGRARGNVPAPDTALLLLQRYAGIAWQPGASQLWEELHTLRVPLGREHYNALMGSLMYTFGMKNTLQMQIIGQAFPMMDTDGVNMFLAAMRDHPTQLGDAGQAWNPSALLRSLEKNLHAQGCAPNELTHVLALEVACAIGIADVAMHHFDALSHTADAVVGASGLALLSEQSVTDLIKLLCRQGRGEALLHALESLAADVLRLPRAAGAADKHGRTLASRWLAVERNASFDLIAMNNRIERDQRTSEANAKKEAHAARTWGIPKFAMPSLSKLKVSELRTEAAALGLPADGTRKDVLDRVRAARLLIKDGGAPTALMEAARATYALVAEGEVTEAEEPQQDALQSSWDEDEVDNQRDADDRGWAEEDVLTVRRTGGVATNTAITFDAKPLQPMSSWRAAPLGSAEAAQLGLALCRVLRRMGVDPTQADLITIARETRDAVAPQNARDILRAAERAGAASSALYAIAAEAAQAAGDTNAALALFDEADLAGSPLLDKDVACILSGEPVDVRNTEDMLFVRVPFA